MGVKENEKLGKWLEQIVRVHLNTLQGRKYLRYQRLVDTKSARGQPLPPNPADYLVGRESTAWFLECKASEVHPSLRNCTDTLRDTQVGLMRLWSSVAGIGGFVLFYSKFKNTLELWDIESVWRLSNESAHVVSREEPRLCMQTPLTKAAKHLPIIEEVINECIIPF